MADELDSERDFNKHNIAEFRANGGKVGGQFEGFPLLILTSTGAKSGTARENLIGYFEIVDTIYVVGSAAGRDASPGWVFDLRATPAVEVEIGAAPIASAYADALDQVFLYAAPVAIVGFVLALMLKQVPLRSNDVSIAADMGEGFAMPTTDSPDQLLENAVGRLIRQGSGMQLRSIAERPGNKLDISRLWALLQVYRFGQAAGQARLSDIAEHVRVPREILEPAFDRLALTGYAQRTQDQFWLTPAGAREVELVRADTLEWLTSGLVQSSGLQVRPDRGEVRKALDRITQDVLV